MTDMWTIVITEDEARLVDDAATTLWTVQQCATMIGAGSDAIDAQAECLAELRRRLRFAGHIADVDRKTVT